jgi:chromosome segregation ATPase
VNIDERLERLVERHEALSMSVELLEKQVQSTGTQVQALVALSERHEKRQTDMEKRHAEVMEAINTLGRIAGPHQDRLNEHGERLDRLEGT